MRAILIHASWLHGELLGRPGKATSDEEAARAGASAAHRWPDVIAALAEGFGRVILALDAGPSWRSEIDPTHTEAHVRWPRPAWAPLRATVAALGLTTVEPPLYKPGAFVPLGEDMLALAGKRGAARDVIATVAAWWLAWRSESQVMRGNLLRIVSGRTTLAGLADAAAGIELVRHIYRPEGDRGWTYSAPETTESLRATLECDPRSVIEWKALATWGAMERDRVKAKRAALGEEGAKKLVAAHGTAVRAVEMAASVKAGDHLLGVSLPAMAVLRAGAAHGGAGIRRALALVAPRADVPIDVGALLGAQRGGDDGDVQDERDGGRGGPGWSAPQGGSARASAPDPVPVAVPAQPGALRGSEAHGGGDLGVDRGTADPVADPQPPALPYEAPPVTCDRCLAGGDCAASCRGLVRASYPAGAILGRCAHGGRSCGVAPAALPVVHRDIKPDNTKEIRPMNQQIDPRQQNQQQPARQRTPKTERADKIKSIFREQIKTLEGLFPTDGRTMVVRAVATAVSVSNDKRMEDNVTAESIAEAAIACHHLGLEVGDQAYIYPFKREAKLIVGPRGLIKLAFHGGFLRSLSARSVFEGDEFTYNLGDNTLVHRKATEGRRPTRTDERGEAYAVPPEQLITHAYAVLDTTTDGRTIQVETWEDLAFYRSFSKANNGPWFDNFEGMARKTVIKRILEFVPRTALLSAALAETSEGTYTLPAEIADIVDKAIRKRDGKAEPAPVPAETFQQQEAAAAQAQVGGAAAA